MSLSPNRVSQRWTEADYKVLRPVGWQHASDIRTFAKCAQDPIRPDAKVLNMPAAMLTDQWVALGEAVRLAREAKRMNQTELGRRVGTSRPTISLIETGQVKYPRLPMLQAIATALDVPVARFLALAGLTESDAAPGQLHWLAGQLDEANLRRLIRIGHALLQEQHDQPQKEAPPPARRRRENP